MTCRALRQLRVDDVAGCDIMRAAGGLSSLISDGAGLGTELAVNSSEVVVGLAMTRHDNKREKPRCRIV